MKLRHYACLLLWAAPLQGGAQSFEAFRPLNPEEVSIEKLSDGMYDASIAFPLDAEAREPCREIPSFISALSEDTTRAALTRRLGAASFAPYTLSSSALADDKLLPKRPLTPPSICTSRCFALPPDARPIRIDLYGQQQGKVCATLPSEQNRSFQSERETCADGSSWHEVVSRPGSSGTWIVCAVLANSHQRANKLMVRYRLLPVRQIGQSPPDLTATQIIRRQTTPPHPSESLASPP